MPIRLCLTLARLCTAMWVGAGFLFVSTSIAEQVHPAFDDTTKDILALIRFPWYYGTGATLLSIAFVTALPLARRSRSLLIATDLLAAALLLMVVDYVFVYQPLREILHLHGTARTAEFPRLHRWSEWINTAGFLLSLAAAVTLCAVKDIAGPGREVKGEPSH